MTLDTATPAALRRVPFSRLPAFSSLFTDYCERYEAVADFYGGDHRRRASLHEAVERAATHPRDRDRLADILLEQNAAWGMDEATRANIERLRDGRSAAVVTGQQVGFLSGPIYTVYKTITTLQLAHTLAEETGRPVVPVFWVEGEDHDYDEISGIALLHRNDVVRLRYEPEGSGNAVNPGPVGRMVLTERVEEMLGEIEALLPPTDFKEDVMARVRAAYRPGTSIEDAFTRFMISLFPGTGLVYINPDDARLKEMTRPLFRRELEEPRALSDDVVAMSRRLEERYHAQVHVRPTNLFLLADEGRLPIDFDGERYRLRGTERVLTRDDLLAVLDESPERFSPNVVTRPLMQDYLLPTASYVAGPGEISYFAQYRPAYAWAGLPMPIIFPRASVTLVESKVRKVLDKYELEAEDFARGVEPLFKQIVLDAMAFDVDDVFAESARALHGSLNDLKARIESVDPTLGRSAEATRVALVKELEKLKERVVRAEKRNHEEVRDGLEKAAVNLFPEGKLQERVLNVLYVLNKYSPEQIAILRQQLSLDTTAHQVVTL